MHFFSSWPNLASVPQECLYMYPPVPQNLAITESTFNCQEKLPLGTSSVAQIHYEYKAEGDSIVCQAPGPWASHATAMRK